MENRKELLAFIDEFGNTSLQFAKPDISTHFIVSSVIIESSQLDIINRQIEEIAKRYSQNGIIKSQKIKSDKKRVSLLKEVVKLDFKIFPLVVDKRKLEGEGFKHSEVFYKFLHNQLDIELFRLYPSIKIATDRYSDTKFMQGFKSYIDKKNYREDELFLLSDFRFVESKREYLVQLADLISGTLGRYYDATVYSEEYAKVFFNILLPKILPIKYFPPEFEPYLHDESRTTTTKYDAIITRHGITLANDFVRENRDNKEEDKICQVCFLNYLIHKFHYESRYQYYSANQIVVELKTPFDNVINSQYLMSSIVAPLRDKGVIIASSRRGYKLPATLDDIYAFVKHDSSIFKPMLHRLTIARNEMLRVTGGDLDILTLPEYHYIKKFLVE